MARIDLDSPTAEDAPPRRAVPSGADASLLRADELVPDAASLLGGSVAALQAERRRRPATGRPARLSGTPAAAPAAPAALTRRTPPPPPPPVPQLPQVPPAEGDLRSSDIPSLVGRLCISAYTGCLLLTAEGLSGAQRALYFEDGAVVALASSLAADSLPEWLHHSGFLSREQLRRAHAVLGDGSAAPDLGEVAATQAERLCAEHLLHEAEVPGLLQQHGTEIFYRILGWERGRYRLLKRAPEAAARITLPETPRLLLEALRRRASLESLVTRVGPESVVLRPSGGRGRPLSADGITPAEQRALSLLDGEHSLGEVRIESGLGEHACYVLAYTLLCLGAMRPAAPPAVVAPAAPPVVAPVHVSHPPPPPVLRSSPANSGELRLADAMAARIRAKHSEVEEADYFAVLELPATASVDAIRRAYETLREEFSGSRVPERCRADLAAELGRIVVVLDEAHALLSDDGVREAYRANLAPAVGKLT